jgi:4-carboxymuconolactone decarboxylase
VGDETPTERGHRVWRETMGFDAPTTDDVFTHYTRDVVFGEIWSDDRLGRRERRMVSLTCTAFSGQQIPLRVHMAAALSTGDYTADELLQWVQMVAFYAGWPVASTAYVVWRELTGDAAAIPAAGTAPPRPAPGGER